MARIASRIGGSKTLKIVGFGRVQVFYNRWHHRPSWYSRHVVGSMLPHLGKNLWGHAWGHLDAPPSQAVLFITSR